MEISGTSTGAATYALKKALDIQGSVIGIIAPQQSSADLLSAKIGNNHIDGMDTSENTKKSGIIDILA